MEISDNYMVAFPHNRNKENDVMVNILDKQVRKLFSKTAQKIIRASC